MDINRKSSNVKKLVNPTKKFYKQLYQKIHELKGKKKEFKWRFKISQIDIQSVQKMLELNKDK